MSAIDSWGWLEYFGDGQNADFPTSATESVSELVSGVAAK